jgi:hypothetical protein
MSENKQIRIDAAAAIVDPQGFRISQVQERITALEQLLDSHGLDIKPGTQLEQVALSVFDALYQRDGASSDVTADIRVGFKHLIGLNELSGLLLGLKDHPEFPKLVPHLRLLNNGLGIQNMPSSAVDQATNKVFELYLALLALQCGSDLELDDAKSQGRNPDVLITIGKRRWGFACKALHGTNPEGFVSHLEKGIDQIEKSPAETGVVVFAIKNILDQSRYWSHTNPEQTSAGAEAEFSAFSDPLAPFALLRDDANAIGNALTTYLPAGYLHAAFAGKKCIPGILICAHVVSAVAFDGIPVPTSTKIMAWQHVGTTPAEDMAVLNCLHEAGYAFDKPASPPAS